MGEGALQLDDVQFPLKNAIAEGDLGEDGRLLEGAPLGRPTREPAEKTLGH